MNLTPEQQGTMTVFAINVLPHKQDLLDGVVDFGCCNLCCASCSILSDLIEHDAIDEVIKLAPVQYQDHDWWVEEKFDRTWADAWWSTFPCPNHQDVHPDE